ncbi:PIR Superfamily Protein [Plasmodium ovale wallikeri]|uniref:PIR Superfamily Protein n=1 Tax=Plasmodium ovale wallikeri TaxID=864142 RepID=A0A1A9APE9_PLAOA|nr:PIR Superfamily Protein [Plasmodium ovale wallikeri]SBT58334.1 PIR Superfamily Protein [Plasmodium ovale wallikeri]
MIYDEDLLKESGAYRKYNELNNVNIPNDYEISFNDALRIEPSNNAIKDICGRIAGNLIKIFHSKDNMGYNTDEECGYLHFWLYDKLEKISRNKRDQTNIEDLFSSIFAGWRNFNMKISNNTCSGRYFDYISLDMWVEGKILHDYFKNYDYISNTQNFNDRKCEKYTEYISHVNTLYKKHIKEYYDHIISRYLSIYTNDEYDPQKLLSKIKCENEESDMLLHPHQSPHARVGMERDNTVSELQTEDVQGDSPSVDSKSSTIVGTSISLIGMFGLLFTGYKFTPLGSLIYGKISKKGKIQDNENHFTNALLGNNAEYAHINENNSTFHVAYNIT